MSQRLLGKIPLYLYKPLETIEHLERLENFLSQNIWATLLEDFNDPFEGAFKWGPIDWDNLEKDLPPFFKDLFAKYQKDNPTHTKEQFKQELTNEEFSSKYLSDQKKIIRQNFPGGVICLTTSFSNIPMWAHYANNHKGYCLIFELDKDKITEITKEPPQVIEDYINKVINGEDIFPWDFRYNFDTVFRFIFLKVKYSPNVPEIDFVKLHKYSDEHEKYKYFFQNSIGTKFIQWKYEDEYRLIVSQNSKNGGLIPLPTFGPFLKITGIIAGKRLKNTPIFNVIKTLTEKYSLKLYQAECSEEEYKVSISQIL